MRIIFFIPVMHTNINMEKFRFLLLTAARH